MASLGFVTGTSCIAPTGGGMRMWCGSSFQSTSLHTLPVALATFRRSRVSTAGTARAIVDQVDLPSPSQKSKKENLADARHEEAESATAKSGSYDLVSTLLETLGGTMSKLRSSMKESTIELINRFVEIAFEASDEPNIYFQGNFGPVEEIGDKKLVTIICGEVPSDFPRGAYIRNGPNPQFGGKNLTSWFGKLDYHWFEGDGMLHATYFEGDGSIPQYLNKYVNTKGYKSEKGRRKTVGLPSFDGSIPAIIVGCLLNQLRFGKPYKETCNTSIYQIGKKWYASFDVGLPLEINPWNLDTVHDGYYNTNGAWSRSITAHPKRDPNTGELVIISYEPASVKPCVALGVISSDGQSLVNEVDLNLDRAILIHDVAITEKYNIIMDWPLVVDFSGFFKGDTLITYKGDSYSRVGVMPRYGDSTSLKWFASKSNFAFHVFNAFDDGDEVVLLGMSSRVPFIHSKPGMDKREWFARGMTTCKVEDSVDPWVDGALFSRLHEWRMNMTTGILTERDLTGDNFSMEMPRINEKYTGLKNRYGYVIAADAKANQAEGIPVYGSLIKIDCESLPREGSATGFIDLPRLQEHSMGPDRYCSEPVFVARPGGVEEDDGWIVTYVHDEASGKSEMLIIDAQNFEKEPLVRMQLPQRVPYGFHGAYVLSE